MVLRFIMRYLANNDQLIEQLSQSKVMRRGAQWTVFSVMKWKKIGNQNMNEMLKSVLERKFDQSNVQLPSKLHFFGRKFFTELKAGVKEFQDEMKRRNKS